MRMGREGFGAWVVGLFSKRKNPLIVVTIEGVPEGDESAIASLKTHPGFLALLYKLRLQKAVLESKLLSSRHDTLRDVDTLVIGRAWLGFLESEVNKATKISQSYVPRQTTDREVEEFERIRSFIETVGTTTPEK